MANSAALASAAGQRPKLRRNPPKISPRKMNSSNSGAATSATGRTHKPSVANDLRSLIASSRNPVTSARYK